MDGLKLKVVDHIADFREALDMTQRRLAEEISVSRRTVNRWEHGAKMNPLERATLLAYMRQHGFLLRDGNPVRTWTRRVPGDGL